MLNNKKPKIIVIVGPTSSGKSDLAVKIAKKINKNTKKLGISGAEIVSADSRQIYKHFNLSSGKITQEEMQSIPHHMLNIASPKRTFTAEQFRKKAKIVLESLYKKNIIPIVCGGTGFWIDSLIYDYSFPNVPPNKKLREKLKNIPVEKLFEILRKIDIDRASNIDSKNKVRLIRAIEIAKKLGSVPKLKSSSKYKLFIIGIEPDIKELHKRINKRINARIKNGMLEEIKEIHNYGVSYNRLKSFGLEFKWISKFLLKEINLNTMRHGLYNDTVKYSKRQMTWFKKNEHIVWIKKPQLSPIWEKITEFIKI